MDLIYRLVKFLVRFTLHQYFKTIDVRGAKRCEQGPLLIVSNHPNYLFDPILIATTYKRPIWFIAKSVVFNTATKPILRVLHAIPIYRRQDNPELMHRNKDSFQHVAECFENGNAILIFPEGLSIHQRSFEPIKSGAARMALQALESEKCMNLQIQPIGLTYSTFNRVRASVTIQFGHAFSVREYIEALSNNNDSVQMLTEEIHKRLYDLTVDIRVDEHARLVEKITTVYSSLNTHTNYQERLSTVRDNLEALGEHLPPLQKELEPEIDDYIRLLNSFGFGTGTVITSSTKRYHILLFPLYLIGWCLQITPLFLIRFLTSRLKNDVILGSITFATSLFTFLLWYLMIGVLTFVLTQSILYGFIAFCLSALIVSLYFHYRDDAHIALFDTFWPKSISPLHRLRRKQQELIDKLEAVRKI